MTAKRLNVRKVVDLQQRVNKELRSLRRRHTFHEKIFPLHSFGTQILRNKFHWLLAMYTNITDHNDVKLLLELSVQKLMVPYDFPDSVQLHAKVLKTNILMRVWMGKACDYTRTHHIENARVVCRTSKILYGVLSICSCSFIFYF